MDATAQQTCAGALYLRRKHMLGRLAGSPDSLDASEDTSSTALWRWELRDTKVLPKGLREEAVAMKKRMQRVSRPPGPMPIEPVTLISGM